MTARPHASARPRFLALLAAAILIAGLAGSAAADGGRPGFRTRQPAMLDPEAPGATVEPIVTVGERIGRYRFEAIPDGISIDPGRRGWADVYVNHETSTVPFPYNPSAPTPFNSQNDFTNSLLSKLQINARSIRITDAEYVIKSSANYQRFCSNFLATAAQGFNREILFTNEEAIDWVNRTGKAWPATIGADRARQAGAVVAYDVASETARTIWGMGRHNHENDVAIPGYGHPVVLSGDDTFVSNPAQSQLYSYIAPNARAVLRDSGDLWAFVANGADDYYDFGIDSTRSVSGKFIKVPKLIASGRNRDGTDLLAADVPAALGGPYSLPPADGSWSRPPGATTGPGVDGPQWVLEHWGDLNGVFQFVRIEDIAYDKRPGMSNVVYFADSGRGATSAGAEPYINPFTSSNGRIWKLVLDPSDPTLVTSLSILIEGDNNPVKTVDEIHQPDNLETTVNGLYVTEDPGSGQQFNFTDQLTDTRRTTARIWQYKFAPAPGAANPVVVAKVDQSADEGRTDVDPAPPPPAPPAPQVPPPPQGNLGVWEASGIVDVSSVFGPGTFLVTIQAHTLWVDMKRGDDNVAPAGPDFTYKREGGQLVLLRIPGG